MRISGSFSGLFFYFQMIFSDRHQKLPRRPERADKHPEIPGIFPKKDRKYQKIPADGQKRKKGCRPISEHIIKNFEFNAQ